MTAPFPDSVFRPFLMDGEQLLWSGRSKQGLTADARDMLLIPFSLLWGGFAIFWNANVWFLSDGTRAAQDAWFFKLWGLPFLAIGLYMIVGRFFHDAHIRRTLVYGVSDRRILILRGPRLTSLDLLKLPQLELFEEADGTGTLHFEPFSRHAYGKFAGDGWWLPTSGSAKFYRIRDPRHVYELIRARESGRAVAGSTHRTVAVEE